LPEVIAVLEAVTRDSHASSAIVTVRSIINAWCPARPTLISQ